MSNSSFCLEQRQQEEQKSRKLLALGVIGSIVLHGAIGSAAIWLKEEPKTTTKPIELIIVDAPKPVPPVPEVLKPKPEPKKLVKVPPPPPIAQPQTNQIVKTAQPQPTKIEPARPKSAQPRVERVIPQPKPIVPTETQRKPSRVESAKPPSNPQPPRQVLTNPSPSVSPTTSVPKSLTTQTANNSPVVPSESTTENNLSEPIPNTGTGNSQELNDFSGTFSGNVEGNNTNNNSGTSTPVAALPTPEPPKPTKKPKQGLKCVRDCNVKYPSVLNGAEGRASVRVTVDSSGNVINAEIATGHSNNQVNEQAILAARKMKFAALSGESTASVKVNISFTTAGSDFERQARERQEQNERKRQAREQQEQQERQAREREQERQAQLEKERQERQQQQEQQSEQPTTEASPPEPINPDVPGL
jgi:protein TonB